MRRIRINLVLGLNTLNSQASILRSRQRLVQPIASEASAKVRNGRGLAIGHLPDRRQGFLVRYQDLPALIPCFTQAY